MIDYYFAIIFFAIFLMIILKILIKNNKLLNDTQKNRFNLISTLIIITSIFEWLGVILNTKPMWTRYIHIFVKVLELSIAPIIPILCSNIIGKIKKPKLIIGFLIGHALLEIASAFTGWIFTVTQETNLYIHQPFYWIYILAFTGCILIFFKTTIDESRRQFGINKILIGLLPVLIFCGLIFQYIGNNIRIIWLCAAIDVLLMYIIYMEHTENLDGLTHLLNRKYYDNTISHLERPSIIFFFDVNDFKHINDTFGHAYGDQTLAKVGTLLMHVFSDHCMCYRIGGDEFCAIIPYPDKPETYLQRLQIAITQEKKEDDRFPNISVGYSIFNKGKNIMDCIKEADMQMYKNKKHSKKEQH